MFNQNLLFSTLADELFQAWKTGVPISLLSQRYPGLTAEDAYQIQRLNRDRALSMGEKITGYKVGLTARELMRSMQVEEPDYGVLYAAAELPADGDAPFIKMFEPKVEGEIAFLMGGDVPPEAAAQDVLNAVEGVCAAFEFPETRIAGWNNRIVDTVSDNSSAGHYMLSGKWIDPHSLELPKEKLTLRKNGTILAEGTADVIMGDPLNSVAWLSNKLRSHGQALRKGDVVLAGALCGAHLAAPGDLFEAEFDRLGTLRVRFL